MPGKVMKPISDGSFADVEIVVFEWNKLPLTWGCNLTAHNLWEFTNKTVKKEHA